METELSKFYFLLYNVSEAYRFNGIQRAEYMKRWGQDALTYPKPITLIKCRWVKKTHNTPLFYILCCAQ